MQSDNINVIVFNACLDYIRDGRDVEESVNDILGMLIKSSSRADETASRVRDHSDYRALSYQLGLLDLTNIGQYSVTRTKDKKGNLTIAFDKSDYSIRFYFKRGSADSDEPDYIETPRQYMFIALSMKQAETDPPPEDPIRFKRKSLDNYVLQNVKVVTGLAGNPFIDFFINIFKSERVYGSK